MQRSMFAVLGILVLLVGTALYAQRHAQTKLAHATIAHPTGTRAAAAQGAAVQGLSPGAVRVGEIVPGVGR